MALPADRRLHYDVLPGEGPPCLLVHGILASRSHWLPNVNALADVCRPVVVELYGHGRSPSPEDAAAYHPDRYVEAFEHIRGEVGAERWFVIGHSLGAALTLRYVIARPDRVVAQVFMNTNSGLATEEWSERVRPQAARAADRIAEGGSEAILGHPLHPSRGRRLDPKAREAMVADSDLHDPAGVANTFRHTTPDSSVRDRLARIRVPTLLVVGTRESSFAEPRAYAEATIRGLEVVELDTGHAVNLEDPDGFNAAVADFFSRTAAPVSHP